jgi:ribosomal protein L11 methyltransferase
MSAGTLRRVSIRVGADRVEEARAAMIELFPEGFEEVEVDGGLELAAFTGAGGEERLWQVLGPGAVQDVDAGWADAWRRFHRPVRVGPLWIGPSWEHPDDGALAVVVDPGQAFGTGGHATTRLCLELLLDLPRGSLTDVGCGSGVLAVAAAKLGFAPVVALDLEPAAVEATQANAAANGVELDTIHSDALVDSLPETEIALANISAQTVERLAPRVPAGTLVASGYLAPDRPELPGWRREQGLESGGWCADVFARVAA